MWSISRCGLVHAEFNGAAQDHRVHNLLPFIVDLSHVSFLASRDFQKQHVQLILTGRFQGPSEERERIVILLCNLFFFWPPEAPV